MASKTIASGGQLTLPQYSGVKAGYSFNGWSCNGTLYQPGQSVTVNANMTFKASWQSVDPVVGEITVTFDVQGGSRTVDPQTIQSGSRLVFPQYDGTKTGFTFGGWACGLKTYQPGQSETITGDITVKAVWNQASEKDDRSFQDIIDLLESNIIVLLIGILCVIVLIVILVSRRRY